MNVTNEERRYRIAVWIVIASEALLFSGLFTLYASYRHEYASAFDAGVREGVHWIGGINTLILLTSSFAIAWSIHLIRSDRGRGAIWSLAAVLGLGLAFLVLKGIEWTKHIHDGIVPGIAYAGPDHGPGTSLYFTLYYGMTGLHALHVIAGLGLVTWVFTRAYRRRYAPERHLSLELVALYWHFVDAIWVFLWPMFYLMHG
ncbi:MAG TPA: cytochrome c oxidase subunit 3 [Kofleriaceae bacterium]|nr:cytochrome c oxidase subunit 3 [Kofleriaceae bacterium]